jgi:hypothetical protein
MICPSMIPDTLKDGKGGQSHLSLRGVTLQCGVYCDGSGVE